MPEAAAPSDKLCSATWCFPELQVEMWHHNEIWNNMMLYEMNLDIQYIYNTYCIATTVGWLISIENNKTKQHGNGDIHGTVQSCTHFRRCYQVVNCCVVLTLRFTCTMILNDIIWIYMIFRIQTSKILKFSVSANAHLHSITAAPKSQHGSSGASPKTQQMLCILTFCTQKLNEIEIQTN